MKTLKVVTIDAQFPELRGGVCNQRGRGTGSSVKAAAARAFSDLLRQPTLRRKRFSRFTAIVSVGQQAIVKETAGND
jgi:hypothetical protein